ncbi:MAG: hypothetical protein Q4P07_07715 [Ornithinimicrobium sp.]|uniref:helix-turn-helix transcriptional regulator n=1 Tax=Ornithinimicrobium sp. TaxID=1977084 RepID=UPI0026E059B0|nr:hypothetical protein [Ornithinimicrobium sp.]MDO5740021.1 hypothetical protein [Ornithinimicrobium sp.]
MSSINAGDMRRAGERREAVLREVEGAPDRVGVGVAELAASLELHPNTVRFHLARLLADGEVTQTTEPPTGPGRPRISYLRSAPVRERNYGVLARMLAGVVATGVPDPGASARVAGVAWGRLEMAEPQRRDGPVRDNDKDNDCDQPVAELLTLLTDVGFQPELVQSGSPGAPQEIWMQHCPFYEAAREHRDVVCALHLGLMEGALLARDSPVGVQRLDPFVRPRRCIAHLTADQR